MKAIRKNRDFNPYNCPVTHCLNRIGGKWKILIIYGIHKKCNRFSTLKKALPIISKQMLVNQLGELEADGIVSKDALGGLPRRIEYQLTPYGLSLLPVIRVMQDWGLADLANIVVAAPAAVISQR